ncbi:hypothetical protein G7092_05850 [Mucilaginibacter sp. HC2]|uniref:hypothetical protein n=1 Tax=Mucilaginibacter inviolabilis TaxID=2714892 RepID=UPI00140A72CC|nr:hypothetical protein [Mucilaginibacter inviolabilis]NHA03305.1 hypothetical protein [Mucilaginibacter inviolabilis]
MVEEANLLISFSKLGMNSLFIKQAEKLGLYNLEDVMKVNLAKLKQHRDFSFTWYAQMLNLLKEQDLLRRFQENNL